MTDARFAERLQRIEAKAKTPKAAEPELLAGVGEVKETRTKLKKKGGSIMPYVLLGGMVGLGAYFTLRELVGVDTILATPPEGLMELGMADPAVGAAGGALALCAALAFLSLFLGRRGAKLRGFSWAALVSVVGGAMVASM